MTVGGTPRRVTSINLRGRSLSGELSGLLGNLSGLTELWLNDNSLTGRIPSRIEQLTNLTHVYLAGNSLSGCTPLYLRTVANNDVAALGLTDCPPPTDISYGEHTLEQGTYKFLLDEYGSPVVFDVPAGVSLEIVGIVLTDASGGDPFIGLILRDPTSRSWICVELEQSEECGRKIVRTSESAGARSITSTATANVGSLFDRISESLWMDDGP